MRRCALFLLIALAVALLAVGAQAQERSDAAGEPPAAPRISRLNWSGLTIRVGWNPVARATGYDLRWTPVEQRRRHLTVSAVDGSPAEFSAPWAGRWRVEVRARIGSGPSAVRGEWSRPRIVRVYDAPPRLGVERFDGEYALLNWTGVGASYELEWGERGKAKQFVRRDGRSPTLKLGPLEGGKTYEFRVRARDEAGHSEYSPTAVFTPTAWRGFRPGAAYVGRIGQIYALWLPQRGAEWYELGWINAADPTETARVRVGTATTGGSRAQVPGQIGRAGGFENGTWNVRVRAGPRGAWSPLYPLTLSNQPERLTLELESSRELCTAGTLTEIMWKISGGSAPYALSVENSTVDVSADNARINCGALSAAEVADEDATLAAKRITAVVTDSRGVRREAAIEVARARALPAPQNVRHLAYVGEVVVVWDEVEGAGSQSPMIVSNKRRVTGVIRTRANHDGAEWVHHAVTRLYADEWVLGPSSDVQVLSVAAVRHPLEVETPSALNWSNELEYASTTLAQNVTLTATHDTLAVSWDRQPYTAHQPVWVWLFKADDDDGWRWKTLAEEPGVSGRHTVTFAHLPPDTELHVLIDMHDADSVERSDRSSTSTHHVVRTQPPPAGWRQPPTGPQNLRYTLANGVITVLWDEPHSDAESNWYLTIENPVTGNSWGRWLYSTSWTWPADLSARPNTQYRVTVEHADVPRGSASVLVTTPPVPTAAGQAVAPGAPDVSPEELQAQALRAPLFVWPVVVQSHYTMTDDPFQWRYDNDDEGDIKKGYYHRGLDIGEYSREARGGGGDYDAVTGEGIYAATDGVLRVFNDDLQNISVLHCPSDDVPLHAQFHLVEKSLSSVWSQSIKTDTLSGSFNEGSLPDEVLCTGIATPASGRVAVLTYERPDGLQVVTKYGHLFVNGFPEDIVAELASNAEVCEPMVRNGVRCKIDFNKSVSVRQGQRIATIGNSEFGRESNITDVGFDQHVHFEMLYLSGPGHEGLEYKRVISQPWGAAKHCGPKYVHRIPSQTPYTSHDCTWRGARPRELGPALDVEAYLPPLPASSVPKNARNVVTDGQSGRVTTSKHVMEVEGIELQRAGSVTSLIVDLSVAFWRPSFYAQYYSNIRNEDPGERGQISRTGRAGIASTGPGVTGYGTDIIAASPGKSDVLCGGGSFQPAPADSSAATDGDGNGEDESESEGELPRQTREVRLSQTNGPCVVYVLTTNSLYPTPEVLLVPRVDDLYRRNIAISDPKATLTWVTELSAGTNVVRDARALIGDALDLYTFTAYAGYTYSFCTYPSTENVCRDESSGDNDAQLLIVGPAGEVTKPNDQRDENGLTWTAPKSSSAKTTYTLVVRRRARFEGTEADYSYRLKYTIEEIGSCALLNPVEVPVCIPPKPAPSVSSRTHNTVTVSWPRPTGAMSYQTNRLPADASCDTEGVKSTFTPHSADAAGGVRGAGNQDLQYTFPGLTASISYTLCVRSVRTISPSFVLESDWVSVSTTTKAEPLPKPGGTSVTDIGQNSMTLNWGEVADAGGYKVKRTGSSSTWTLPSTSRSHRFTGLSSDTYYTLSVQTLPKAGSSKVASAWAHKPGRTDKALTPTPSPQPDPPPTPSLTTCLSSTALEGFALWLTDDSHCRSARASALWGALRNGGIEVGCISRLISGSGINPMWERYQAAGGGTNFLLEQYDLLWLSRSACPTDSGVAGSADADAPNCAEAAKPETGPAVISVGGAACVIVRGGGAVQVSDGEYSLNLTLPNERDWLLLAASEFTGSSAGTFWVYDLSTSGWIALYPPDGFELERHTPADAAALPALLDAIAASASTPATE